MRAASAAPTMTSITVMLTINGNLGEFTKEFTGFQSINVTGTGSPSQSVELQKALNLTGNLSIDRVGLVANTGSTWGIGGSLSITAVGPGGVSATGAYKVAGSTQLSTSGPVMLGGANDF